MRHHNRRGYCRGRSAAGRTSSLRLSSLSSPAGTILASPPTCVTYSSGVGPAHVGAADKAANIRASASAPAIRRRGDRRTACPLKCWMPLRCRARRIPRRCWSLRGNLQPLRNFAPTIRCGASIAGRGLDALHVRVGQAEMMTDLMHKDVCNEAAQGFFAFRPAVEKRAAV